MRHFYTRIEGWCSYRYLYERAVKRAPITPSRFVEVGSWRGKSSAFMAVEIANSRKPIEFFCVDTWKGSPEHQDDPLVKKDQLFEDFLKNTHPVSKLIKPIRGLSVEVAATFEDASLDFICIDAAHDYTNVLADLKAWWPKLRPGGMMIGDDFNKEGVRKAVEEFFREQDLPYIRHVRPMKNELRERHWEAIKPLPADIFAYGTVFSKRPTHTIGESLASADTAGFTNPYFALRNGLDAPAFSYPHTVVLTQGEAQSVTVTYLRLLLELVSSFPDASYYILAEDDITWAPDSAYALWRELEWLANSFHPVGIYSPYLSSKQAELSPPPACPTWFNNAEQGWEQFGGQCYILPVDAAHTLLAGRGQFLLQIAQYPKAKDRIFGAWCAHNNFAFLYRHPSLLHHRLGSENSSLDHKKPRDAALFLGHP